MNIIEYEYCIQKIIKILKRNTIQCSNGIFLLFVQLIKQRHTVCILVFY